MDTNLYKSRTEILLLFLLYLLILPRVYMEYDMGFWKDWALQIRHSGLANAYSGSINYLPIYIYGLYFYDLLQGTDAAIIHNINNIKLLFTCFDFLPIVVLCCFRQKILTFKVPYLYLLLNIAYVFNSLVWGQIDSIYVNLAFLAILTSVLYPVGGLLLYILALNTKQQAIVFLPVMAIVMYYRITTYRTIFLALFACIALQFLLVLPFIGNGGALKLWQIIHNTIGLYNNLSISAFNFWYLVAPGNPYFINHNETFIFFSYKIVGLLLFSISGLFVLFPLFQSLYKMRRNNLSFDKYAYEHLFLATGLICLFFFYFNSQMHERYAHPVIIFFFFYGVVSRNYKLYVIVSIAYFLSLDKAFSFPDGYLPIIHYKAIFASKVIALWYTAAVIYGSYLYYRLVSRMDFVRITT